MTRAERHSTRGRDALKIYRDEERRGRELWDKIEKTVKGRETDRE